MFHLNSKSNKRCNGQGITISFPRRWAGLLRAHRSLAEMWAFASLLPCSSSCYPHVPWGQEYPQPCFPSLSRGFFHLALPNTQPLPSRLSPTPSIAHPSCSGLGLVKQLNPLECFCCEAGLRGQGIRAGSPQSLQVPSFSPFAEIYWSNKSSAMMEKN